MKIRGALLVRQNLCFSSYKNRKLKVKLWWVGSCERKKVHFLWCLFFPKAFNIFVVFQSIASMSIGENHKAKINIFNIIFLFLQKRFYHNYMVLNTGKCGNMSFSFNPEKSDLILKGSSIIPSAEEYVVLGVTIDNRLTFYDHLKNLCKK